MKKILIVLILVMLPGFGMTREFVTIPWEEVKTLFKEQVEKKIRKEQAAAPYYFNIHSADYQVSLEKKGCKGRLMINGNVISGDLQIIHLFDRQMIIKEILTITGGALVNDPENDSGVSFLPDKPGEFSLELSFYLPIQEDRRSNFITLNIPKATKNSLRLNMSKDLVLIAAPGIKDESGSWKFSSGSDLDVRFAHKNKTAGGSPVKNPAKKFDRINSPPAVLDSISCFTSFEENGNVLSVFMMNVPRELGDYLTINAIPDAKIWSLKVNGENVGLYGTGKADSKQWVIPLNGRKMSHVELAVINQGKNLGLHGKLETTIPGMAIAARHLYVAVALPERLELVSFEGPVSTGSKSLTDPPKEFIGKPYYFFRSFYRGHKIKMSVTYKEPVK